MNRPHDSEFLIEGPFAEELRTAVIDSKEMREILSRIPDALIRNSTTLGQLVGSLLRSRVVIWEQRLVSPARCGLDRRIDRGVN